MIASSIALAFVVLVGYLAFRLYQVPPRTSCASCRYYRPDVALRDVANDGGRGTCRRKLPEMHVQAAAGELRVAGRGGVQASRELQVLTFWPPVDAGEFCAAHKPAAPALRRLVAFLVG